MSATQKKRAEQKLLTQQQVARLIEYGDEQREKNGDDCPIRWIPLVKEFGGSAVVSRSAISKRYGIEQKRKEAAAPSAAGYAWEDAAGSRIAINTTAVGDDDTGGYDNMNSDGNDGNEQSGNDDHNDDDDDDADAASNYEIKHSGSRTGNSDRNYSTTRGVRKRATTKVAAAAATTSRATAASASAGSARNYRASAAAAATAAPISATQVFNIYGGRSVAPGATFNKCSMPYMGGSTYAHAPIPDAVNVTAGASAVSASSHASGRATTRVPARRASTHTTIRSSAYHTSISASKMNIASVTTNPNLHARVVASASASANASASASASVSANANGNATAIASSAGVNASLIATAASVVTVKSKIGRSKSHDRIRSNEFGGRAATAKVTPAPITDGSSRSSGGSGGGAAGDAGGGSAGLNTLGFHETGNVHVQSGSVIHSSPQSHSSSAVAAAAANASPTALLSVAVISRSPKPPALPTSGSSPVPVPLSGSGTDLPVGLCRGPETYFTLTRAIAKAFLDTGEESKRFPCTVIDQSNVDLWACKTILSSTTTPLRITTSPSTMLILSPADAKSNVHTPTAAASSVLSTQASTAPAAATGTNLSYQFGYLFMTPSPVQSVPFPVPVPASAPSALGNVQSSTDDFMATFEFPPAQH